MVEKVQTGGVMSFDYSNSKKKELDIDTKNEIEEAYIKASERKMREKKKRMILWIVVILVLILVGLFTFLR
ncbi:MAG: hypothetical protein Q8P15_02410 [Nanoarchaeota archaeon]|nr:hypothetical protein [Nanoarchaeota archaeon]